MSRIPSKRLRPRKPGPLAALLRKAMQDQNLTYRDLAERTAARAKQRDPDDEGVGMTVIGSIVRGETQEPLPRNLWLLSEALGLNMGDLLLAMGYDPSDLQTTPASVDQQRVIALIRGSGPEDLKRIERTLSLDSPGKAGLDAFLTANEARLRRSDRDNTA